jgi:hypothetical protein
MWRTMQVFTNPAASAAAVSLEPTMRPASAPGAAGPASDRAITTESPP